eukprot:CAMPEP_0198437542 /NCGR_PEP_ID=MMETSP1452-20131203/47386_1 /TAXON_ID=1181717 /ORGANISM="Synchroma pusillum, Strain CCMP3072" /LENGTH=159 /DNA_ID=CAMNT_0044158111 /DNA_START=1 /DNA_END=477 /DNA_ORIENTATION=+
MMEAAGLSRTPPSFAPSSYERSHMKRSRAGSISGRLRACSDLEESGVINHAQKGVMKDLIISGDEALRAALDVYDDTGDASHLHALMRQGLLNGRRHSIDLLEDLDFSFLTVDAPHGAPAMQDASELEIGDFSFDATFGEDGPVGMALAPADGGGGGGG